MPVFVAGVAVAAAVAAAASCFDGSDNGDADVIVIDLLRHLGVSVSEASLVA